MSDVIGVVFNRASKAVVRIINPDHESELDRHQLSPDEYLLRFPKQQFGVSHENDAMTPEQAFRVCKILGG